MQEEALRSFYPHFYRQITTIPSKKYKPFIISNQFNPEEQGVGCLENIPDFYVERMKNEYHKFYDLWIDGMQWLDYKDLNWQKYFYNFPRPFIKEFNLKLPAKFALLHLASNNLKSSHRNEQWYVEKLVKKLSSFITCLIISTEATEPYLSCLKDIPNTLTVKGNLEEIGYYISKCDLFLGIDSGLRLDKSCIIYAAQCYQPHKVLPSHKLRWLHFENDYMPVNYNLNYVSDYAKRLLENPAYALVPELTDFKNQGIVRDYKVNLEKSILQ
jgi:hypothetical protein